MQLKLRGFVEILTQLVRFLVIQLAIINQNQQIQIYRYDSDRLRLTHRREKRELLLV